MSERVESKMRLEQNRWLYELYWTCTEILTEEEREIYFARYLDDIEKLIHEEHTKLNQSLDDSIGLIRHSERLMDLACTRVVLKDFVEDTALKDQYPSIPKKKLLEMGKLESYLSREGQAIH